MPEGIFHDAHEVYKIDRKNTETWVATMASKELADLFVTTLQEGALRPAWFAFSFEVRPV